MFKEISNRKYELKNDIAYYFSYDELENKNVWAMNEEWQNSIINGKWVENNWKNHFSNKNINYVNIAKRINEKNGLIMEIGAGPGGGNMPYILDQNEKAQIIITDLSSVVVEEWKKLFDNNSKYKNIYYAVLNHCKIPFKDNSIDIVSSSGGFANTEGDKIETLKEIYRVLKPNGLYVDSGIWLNNDHAKNVPERALEKILEKFPEIVGNFYDESVKAGFKNIETIEGGTWSNENDESTLASLCRELGTYLVFNGYTRYSHK
jgi:ubiquinone/menaquinone biosynthesis C-methylase UbiE